MRQLVLATRRSALALAQARAFARALSARHPSVDVRELLVVTTGDRVLQTPLAEMGGKGLFTKEIEEALDRHEADFAVHSFKDVPAEIASRFVIACVPTRADPRDVIVCRSGQKLAELPSGARLGTSSVRRAAQLSFARPDLTIVPLRGNVDTRLRKLDGGELDAVVLARAGLERLGLAERATETLDERVVVPAPAQGALAIECRAGDGDTRELLAALSDRDAEIAVACERGAMRAIGGNCTVPFGAYAARQGRELSLRCALAGLAGAPIQRAERVVSWPDTIEEAAKIGHEVAATLRSS